MSKITPLSTGCLKDIMSGKDVDKPILQILGTKKIAGGEGSDRYRLLISDGKYLNSFSMLATQMNDLITQGKLVEFTIIRAERYITSMVNKSEKGDRRVLIILDVSILNHGSEVKEKVGNPVQYEGESSQNSNVSSSVSACKPITSINTSTSGSSSSKRQAPANLSIMNNNEIFSPSLVNPIVTLSPYQNKWVIKARVTAKSNVRTWSNAKGDGKLFSMDLIDETGEIRATAFNDVCEKFYDLVEIDKVYYISKGILKPANKNYTHLKNDYELTLTNETVLKLCEDMETGIPKIQYNLVPISQISNIEPKAIIDVIGVCKNVNELQTFIGKANNREYKKREITLVDLSNASVDLTLWGDDAVNFEGHIQPIVLVKGARVGEFGGAKNISLGAGSNLKINPDIPESYKLRGWFDEGGASNVSTNISARTGASSGALSTEWLTFHEARLKNLGSGDKPDYFQTKAVVNIVKSPNAIYKACPQAECNKKVIDEENGYYRCEKCNTTYPDFKYRLLINMSIGDWTSNRWVTCFSDLAEQIYGKSAKEIGDAIDQNPDRAEAILSTINFKSFVFKLRTKVEIFGDMHRNKITVVNASPMNHKQYNAYLLKNLQDLTGIGKK